MKQPELTTENLLVRPWRDEDAEAIFRACQDPEIQRWTNVPRPYEMAHADGFIARCDPTWVAQTGAGFGVFDATTGELLGSTGLVGMDLGARTGEIGYWVAPWARNRGVATKAGRAVATWALEILGLQRLVWQADVGNHASRLVALRIGVKMEGTRRAGLRDVGGTGRTNGWLGAVLPGEVITATPPALGPDSPIAMRARVFGVPMPTLSMPGGGMLRGHGEDDIDAVNKACQDPETVRWTTVPPGYERVNAEHFVRHYARDNWAEGSGGKFAIADETGAYCGGIDLRISTKDPAEAEIGFQVAPWARGRGLAPAAARTICAWGFDKLGLNRIIWRAHVGNDASRRVAEKAGFTYEGIQRAGCEQRGERRDAWVSSLLATDPR